MAELFLARDRGGARADERPVVIKRLLPHMASEPQFKDMFLDEAKLTKRLSHPKIAQTYDFGRCGTQLFIAMEFVDGIDALALLRECAHRRVRLPPQIAVYTVHEILDALDFAHTQEDDKGEPLGVVHRDISPSNVLLARNGDIKLVDFGIARASERSHHTKDGTLKGKYGYMSPEQVIDDVVDARSDLFSVGIVLAELLTGRRLFAAPNELDVLLMVRDARLDRLDRYGTHIGVDLDRILRKALRKSQDERFGSAAEFRDALGEWMHLHHHEVGDAVISEVVDSFYDDAWQRKRGAVPGAWWREQRKLRLAEGSSAEAVVADGDISPDGVPVGTDSIDTDNMPVMSIEDVESAPIDIRGISNALSAHPPEVAPEVAAASAGADVIPIGERAGGQAVPDRDPPDLQVVASASSSAGSGPAASDDDGIVSMHIDIGETERVQDIAISSHSEPITVELIDLADDDDLAQTIADFTPGPLTDSILRAAANELLDAPDDEDSDADAPGGEPSPQAAPEPAAMRNQPPADLAGGLSFSSIDDALEALAPADSATFQRGGARAQDRDVASTEAAAAKAASEQGEPLPDTPDDAGDFAETSPIGVLYRLSVSRATGLLVVSVGGIRKEIYFRKGIPEYVSSNVTNELFGEYLVQEGVLSSGELSMALAMMPRYKNRLGDTLVGLNLLTPLEVLRYLTRQVRKKLVDVCTWAGGTFAWYAGIENKREAFPLDLNTFEVLGAGALDLSDEVITGWLDRLDDAPVKLVPTARARPEIFQLGASMRDVCRVIDGERSAAEVRAKLEDMEDSGRALRIFYLLVESGLVA